MRRLRFIVLGSLLFSLLLSALAPQQPTSAAQSERPNPGQFLTGPNQGAPLDIALNYIRANRAKWGLTKDDVADLLVTDNYTSNGITHIYLRQRVNGIEIHQANININIARDGSIINLGNDFVPNARAKLASSKASLSATRAVEAAAQHFGLQPVQPFVAQPAANSANQATLVSDGGIARQDIPAKLVYQLVGNRLRLAWNAEIDLASSPDYWSIRVDAQSGAVLDKYNYTIHDNFGTPEAAHDTHADNEIEPSAVHSAPRAALAGQYNVFALPVESPNHGSRRLVSNPEDTTASPYGWHDTNGSPGAEYTTTRGNNVNAYEDGNNRGFQPNGGAALNFDYPLDLTQGPDAYESAAITNLFYWNNLIHDIFYRYGFDERSGNFQTNNYGKGGAGNDQVNAEAQDGGGTNNANFSAPPDGSSGRMQMYLWTRTTPQRDGDLDNGIIIHEYGHGISIRLTGGPSNSGCLSNQEQAGEGWSDWFATVLTIEPGDKGTDRRGMGTYALGQPTSGNGIRTYPYSTDMTINRHTYDSIKSAAVPHGVGSVWAQMLWEVTWNLIDQYGFDPNPHTGQGGNNIALKLVTEGLKLQKCNPGFVDSRDAILSADRALYNGAHQCAIWRGFAKRGLGFSASQGSSSSATDGTQAFDLPSSCSGTVTPTPITPTRTPITPTRTPITPTRTPITPTRTPVTPTTTPIPGIVFSDDFESDKGWAVNPNGSDTATSGRWERGDPEQTQHTLPSYQSIALQLGNTTSGSNDLVTGRLAGSSVGANDLDGGVTSIASPFFDLPNSADLQLSFKYYLAHLDNSSSDDYLRVSILDIPTAGKPRVRGVVFEKHGQAANVAAAWTDATIDLSSYAGLNVQILIEAADSGAGSLLEAAIDDVVVTSGGGVTPTPTPDTPTPTPVTVTPTPVTPTPITPTPGNEWKPYTSYTAGTVVTYQGVSYRCLQSHTSYPGWEPPNVPALWQRIG